MTICLGHSTLQTLEGENHCLCIGHCRMTHSFLFRQEHPPLCQRCVALLRVPIGEISKFYRF